MPSDQKLLTLLHSNLVRAMIQNVAILGLDPDDMRSDLESPFNSTRCKLQIEALPKWLRPTELQLSVPHSPELDVFPFPKWRDNMLSQGWTHPENEFCMEMLYGVEHVRITQDGGLNGRTGLIAWGEPWLQESWEIEEALQGIAREY